jgi:4-amino-4-deoxy-L-arabinose transferase-like glycosyltransferase
MVGDTMSAPRVATALANPADERPGAAQAVRSGGGWWLLPIILVAAAARLFALGSIPYGIWYDEALNGLEGIAAALAGRFPVFYPANFGREGLYINLVGLSERVLGVTPFALRLPAALAGIATVAFVYLVGRELYSPRVGLLAAWFTASGFWAVVLSRISLRAVLAPLLLAATLYFAVSAVRRRSLWRSALAGLGCGLGFHSYPTFRMAPLLLLCVFIAQLRGQTGDQRNELLRLWSVMAATAIAVASPLLLYFARHPADAMSRGALLVWHFDRPVLRVIYGIGVAVRMFVFESDLNWRHNYHGQPQLLWPVAIFFLTGAAVTLWRLRGNSAPWQWLPWAWLCIGLIPCVITYDIPHALRAGIVLPAAYLLCALGADALLNLASRRLARGAILALIVAGGAGDLARYFGDYAPTVAATEAFCRRDAAIARELNAQPAAVPRFVLVPRDPFFRYAVEFGVYGHPQPNFVALPELMGVRDLRGRFPAGAVLASTGSDARVFLELEQRGVALLVVPRGEIALAFVQ